MNKLSLLLLPILFFGLVSCGSNSNETVPAISKTDSCQVNSKNVYEVYIPARKKSLEKLPLLVIVDAHGRGKFALDKFKHGVNQFPAIVVASDYVKNGFMNYDVAIENLINDVCQKYPVGETIFMTGFSGGARMALSYGMTHHLSGLLLCGALTSPGQIKSLHCPVYSISGMDDFNFIETAQFLFQEKFMPSNLHIEITNASHGWPDSLTLADAYDFLYFSGKGKDLVSPTRNQLSTYCQYQKERIDTLKKQKDYLKATVIAHNMMTTAPFNNDKSFASSYNDLRNSAEYGNELNQLKNSLIYEMNERKRYINAFSAKDTKWWKNEITAVVKEINKEKDPYIKAMYSRVKAFWGIACYSLCNKAIREQDMTKLNKTISIYRMLEPENPDMFYFSAYAAFKKGNRQATVSYLKKSLKAGYFDINQIRNSFPENITSQIGL